jgi:hypothetical protein
MPQPDGRGMSRTQADKRYDSRESATINRLRRALSVASTGNVRTSGVMSSPPTVTANGTSRPGGMTREYFWPLQAGLFQFYGGTATNSSSGIRRCKSLGIAASGGNIGSAVDPGAAGTYWRVEMMVDAIAPAFRVGVSTARYRFIVNGQYVALDGITTLSSSGTYEYITLDFTAVGGRALRHIVVEGVDNCGFDAVAVGPTESVFVADRGDVINGTHIGDSYAQGTIADDATPQRGDGMVPYFADLVGIKNMVASGSGGTGWATANAAYNFGQRVTNGDLALCGTPDVVFFQGSYNDRNNTPATVTTNALAAMRLARTTYPFALIVVFGAFAGSTGPSSNVAGIEAAIASAYASFADAFSMYIPISPATNSIASMINGTGSTAAPASNGNADVYMGADLIHLNLAGNAFAGKYMASRYAAALASL